MLLEIEGLFGGGTCSISVTNLEVLPHAQKEMVPLYSFGLMFGMGIIYNKSSQGSLLLPKPKIPVATFLSAQDIAVHFHLGLKTKTKIFDYQELFSRFYLDSGVNENENGYQKYRNENGIFIRN